MKSYFASESHGQERERSLDYICGMAAYPDKGSEFDSKIGCRKYGLRIPKLGNLIFSYLVVVFERSGYDVLILEDDERIVGSNAFQIHEKKGTLEAFSVKVDEAYRERGLARQMHEKLIERARQRGIGMLRIGAGGHEFDKRLHKNFSSRESELGIKSLPDYWVKVL